MGDIITLRVAHRRIMPKQRITPTPRVPERSISLDAIGRIAALMVQIAVLEPLSDLPSGITTVVTHDGIGKRLTADEVGVLAEELMDDKADMLDALGSDARTTLHACMVAFRSYIEA